MQNINIKWDLPKYPNALFYLPSKNAENDRYVSLL